MKICKYSRKKSQNIRNIPKKGQLKHKTQDAELPKLKTRQQHYKKKLEFNINLFPTINFLWNLKHEMNLPNLC